MMGIYTRVSTPGQAETGVSLNNQKKRGIERAESLGLEWRYFEDAGISGSTIEDRPGLKSLLEAISQKKITHLYFFDVERLTRGNVFEWGLLQNIFKEYKVRIYQDSGETRLDNDGEVLMLSIKQIFGHYENSKRNSTIISNLETNAKNGKWGGGNRLPFGYMRDDKKMLVIKEDEVPIVREAYNLSLENKGIRVIANMFNEKGYKTRFGGKWRDGTIYHILTNTLYYGKRKYNDLILDCPAIISKELFDMVQQNLTNNKRFKPDKKHFYLLKGMIQCECGKSFFGKKRSDLKDKAYVCLSSRYTKEYCGCRGIDIDYLNSVVLNSVKALPEHIEKFYDWFEKNDMMRKVKIDLKSYREKELKTQTKIDNLMELAADGEIPKNTFKKKILELNAEMDEYNKKKLELVPQLGVLNRKEEILKQVNTYLKKIDKLDEIEQQNIIRALVQKVYVSWIPTKDYHVIVIEYAIDSLSEYKISNDIQIEYQKKGWRLDRKSVATKLKIRQIGSEVFVTV